MFALASPSLLPSILRVLPLCPWLILGSAIGQTLALPSESSGTSGTTGLPLVSSSFKELTDLPPGCFLSHVVSCAVLYSYVVTSVTCHIHIKDVTPGRRILTLFSKDPPSTHHCPYGSAESKHAWKPKLRINSDEECTKSLRFG
ncbi:hypothetical protein DFH08DRAFT_806822 [Mycena albidolilacea]|uniref:Uncharacterized protein n=1 Tax=Mycena albidolilacea TaxID=1033008 RepID=A0AAD7ETS0_9AGAR|nr:hypothetical protein DFH08DRAFT_806822 [Mycena albidolilacea]